LIERTEAEFFKRRRFKVQPVVVRILDFVALKFFAEFFQLLGIICTLFFESATDERHEVSGVSADVVGGLWIKNKMHAPLIA